MAIAMKTHLVRFTTQSIKNLRGILAVLIATLIFFNLLPKAWGVDLFWEDTATPATADGGTWTTLTGSRAFGLWSSTNNPWADGSVARFLGKGCIDHRQSYQTPKRVLSNGFPKYARGTAHENAT